MKTNLNTKYYYVVNEDLKMSKGKIAAQVSHVAMQLGESYEEIGRAVILRAKEEKLRSILRTFGPVFYILDAGLTEVPVNSLTVIGFKETEITKGITSEMKLL